MTTRHAELAFNAITIEGGLIAADWLARAAQLNAPHQTPADYDIEKGLELRDEIGRNWRIAKSLWSDFHAGKKAKGDAYALTRVFIPALLQKAFGFSDLVERPAIKDPSLLVSGPFYVEPLEDGGTQAWPISAFADSGRIPLVLAPAGEGLDRAQPAFGDTKRKRSAFGLTQDFLNASEDAVWGICSDGHTLRILRDNASMTRPAWVEFDLESIFSADLYPDFAAAWLILHRSRFGRPDQGPETCPLEAWRTTSREEGTRARDRLRGGFEEALKILGQGFYAHPKNEALRQAIADGELTLKDYFGELLRLVYRVIFLLTIEERDLLHPKATLKEIRERYAAGYSMQRLRDRSSRRAAHDRFSDLWDGLKIVLGGLAKGQDALGLPALAGIFAEHQCPNIDRCQLGNRDLLSALFELCWLRESTGLTRVNWRDMGPDELGYVYEGLLELVPTLVDNGRAFAFANAEESRGNARKTSGSYYTPDSLVETLLESALQPVIDQTIAAHPGNSKAAASALLELSIVDPACGSGHFLLAAARRVAEHVARLNAEGTPTPEEYRRALRIVVGSCIYGVDLNPLAVELCKVALWMEAIQPGLPLTFLDARIRHGNALLGTSRELMGGEVPDSAWEALEGDEKKTASALKKKNAKERKGQGEFNFEKGFETTAVQQKAAAVEALPDTNLAALATKIQSWHEYQASEDYQHAKLVYDAWCAAFVWRKPASGDAVEAAPTTSRWLELRAGRYERDSKTVELIKDIAREYDFFHWELNFPVVFKRGGFDVVLGNPPWERVKLQEQEFFALRDPDIATAKNAAARTRMIKKLPESDHGQRLYEEFLEAKRSSAGQSHFLRSSGLYQLTGTGDINTYQVFAERNRTLLADTGRVGMILPTGIATDATTQAFFRDVIERRSLVSIYDFENSKPLFVGVHRSFKFCLLTLVGRAHNAEAAQFAFFLQDPKDLSDDDRVFTLTPEEILLLNPNTGTCPVFRSRRDAEITLGIYRRIPVLINQNDPEHGNPWGVKFMRMFDMSNDSHLFHDREELEADGWVLKGNIFERVKKCPPPPQ